MSSLAVGASEAAVEGDLKPLILLRKRNSFVVPSLEPECQFILRQKRMPFTSISINEY